MKQKQREKMQPKMGKMDIDYQVLFLRRLERTTRWGRAGGGGQAAAASGAKQWSGSTR